MGCDIHFYVETKQPDGSWKTADKWTECEYEKDTMVVTYRDSFYKGRNYSLFSILADVRNGFGFAGVDTGEGFHPISEPRGIPEDSCEEYKTLTKRWDGDGHSHSYLTLDEILDYDWTQVTERRGCVNITEWAQYRSRGKPESWCGRISGPNIEMVTISDMEMAWIKLRNLKGYPEMREPQVHLNNNSEKNSVDLQVMSDIICPNKQVHTKISWKQPYYETCEDFWSETIPQLLALGKPEDTRLVFFFDN